METIRSEAVDFAKTVAKLVEMTVESKVTVEQLAERIEQLEKTTNKDRDYVSKLENRVADLEESHCLLSEVVAKSSTSWGVVSVGPAGGGGKGAETTEPFRITRPGKYLTAAGIEAVVKLASLTPDAELVWQGTIDGREHSWWDNGRSRRTMGALDDLVARIDEPSGRQSIPIPPAIQREAEEVISERRGEPLPKNNAFTVDPVDANGPIPTNVQPAKRREWWGVEIRGNVHFFQTHEAANQLVSSYGGQSRLFPVIELPSQKDVNEAVEYGLSACDKQRLTRDIINLAIRKLLGGE